VTPALAYNRQKNTTQINKIGYHAVRQGTKTPAKKGASQRAFAAGVNSSASNNNSKAINKTTNFIQKSSGAGGRSSNISPFNLSYDIKRGHFGTRIDHLMSDIEKVEWVRRQLELRRIGGIGQSSYA
jgi:hypothetical protein